MTGPVAEPIEVQATFDVVAGRLADVERLRAQLAAHSLTGVARFSLELSTDGQRLDLELTTETYDAFQSALAALGPLFAQLDGPAQITRLNVIGDVPSDMRAALAPFNPTFA